MLRIVDANDMLHGNNKIHKKRIGQIEHKRVISSGKTDRIWKVL